MDQQDDDRLSKILRAARTPPKEGWRDRALEAMAAVRPRPSASRLRWLPTILGAALVVAALAFVPYSASTPGAGPQSAYAAQRAMAAEALGEAHREGANSRVRRGELQGQLRSYAERAPRFVRERYPNDPQMLIAAGLLTRDLNEALSLTKAGIENNGAGPAWAAYAGTLMEIGPRYYRLGISGVDPGDDEAVATELKHSGEAAVPTPLSASEVRPIMEALEDWQKAEPQNAVPVAFEAYYLYGLHRDREALARWEEAGRLPEVDSHHQTGITGTTRLLESMGMSPWEALSNSYNSTRLIGMVSKLRHCARIGLYEGRLAQLQGRPEDAVRWWMVTVEFGRHMQQSADTLIECLVGVAIEAIGAAHVWVWRPDQITGIPGGPLLGGRYFYGDQHDFFVSHAGEEAAEQVRDSMVRAKVRSKLSSEHRERSGGVPEGWLRSMILAVCSRGYGALLVGSILVFAGVSTRARKRADEATSLTWLWRVLLALLALAPVSIAFSLTWLALQKSVEQPGLPLVLHGSIALSFLSMLLLPLLAAVWSRTAAARLLTAWRGNLRRVLPVGVVVLAALSLGLGITGRRAEAQWARTWQTETEMERVVRAIGPEWNDPPVPEDAWRPQPPPQPDNS
jgi:hypothetical protein